MALQELWNCKENNKIRIPGYEVIRTQAMKRKACGIAMIIRKEIKYKVKEIINLEKEIELISIEITTKSGERIKIIIHPHHPVRIKRIKRRKSFSGLTIC